MRDLYAPPAFYIHAQIEGALKEDFGHGSDLTSQTVLPAGTHAEVHMVARQDLTLAGIGWAQAVLQMVDASVNMVIKAQDGVCLKKGDVIAILTGDARSIMSAERVMLNFAGHLSGVATLTARYHAHISQTKARVTCTRKTLPNLRAAQKYAVRCGGGISHRHGVDDAVLIKDNHIGVCGSVQQAVQNARAAIGHTVKIEVECDTYAQFLEAWAVSADIIMLDNMTLDNLKQCVAYKKAQADKQHIILEASGGVTLDTIKQIAETGVDVISVGALTHSAPNADMAFDFVRLRPEASA